MFRRSTVFPHALTALIAVLILAGCSTLSPYSHLTKLNLRLTASDQLNPDLNGRPSPIVVRLYELKHAVAFENADFFSLYERARESLAPDMVATEELELRPGETLELKLSVQKGSRYVGVVAAYRDLSQASWRSTLHLAPRTATEVDLILDESGIQTSPEALAEAVDQP
ncbi:type VI secretion system lipoprotein TssJ [Pseudomonas sp. W2-17]|uniref:type VI secretion system lipoprotein TssJ n=1 Tax=Pseudomonas sp. W2-17 TaxID=3058039 RepID=UPI0034E08F2B